MILFRIDQANEQNNSNVTYSVADFFARIGPDSECDAESPAQDDGLSGTRRRHFVIDHFWCATATHRCLVIIKQI